MGWDMGNLKMKIKGVIRGAGFATIFLPITKAQSKEMLPTIDTPVTQWSVEEFIEAFRQFKTHLTKNQKPNKKINKKISYLCTSVTSA